MIIELRNEETGNVKKNKSWYKLVFTDYCTNLWHNII